jgi:uncharacterized protein (TIGR03435 family)
MRTVAALLVAISAGAQTRVPSPQFEVASIKPAPPPDPRGMTMRVTGGPGSGDPSLFLCENCSLTMLVLNCYELDFHQLSGPDWLDFERFTVSAKVPEGTTKEQFRLMKQNLLVERFKLKFHYVKNEMPSYVLTVAKNGPKLKTAAEGAPAGSRMSGGDQWKLHIDSTPMTRFASQLSAQLKLPVTDATGLPGSFEIDLHWVRDTESGDAPGPSLFDALQEQLGLKLEKKKEMVDVLVVDHIEKAPTEN